MSIAGMVAIRGSVATVRRATRSPTSDLSVNRAWATAQNGLQVDLSVLDRATAEKVWGLETKATIRGVCPTGSNVLENDGLQVTTGLYAGRNLKVLGVKEYRDSLGTDHLELGLQLTTTETFA